MQRLVAAIILCLSAGSAGAIDIGLRQTLGSDDYKGTYGYLEIGAGALSIRPEADLFTSDKTTASFKTFAARLGYDTSILGLGVTGGATPEEDDYSNAFAGADATLTFSATGGGRKRIRTSGGGAPRGRGLARVDAGAGALVTKHEDKLNAARTTLANKFEVTQTDLSVFAGASFVGIHASANLTQSDYNKTLTASDRPAQRLKLDGVNMRLEGFPETSLTLHAEIPFLPLINPFVTYNRTSYKASTLTTRVFSVGAHVGLEMLEVFGAFEALHPSVGKDSTAVTVGASLRFGLGG
ncbi:MAG: hypothetical protein HYT79_02445 [Elusimicrobia bacterium]|nr:hypothetical protein [Elusimicrobiota bacterium]